jgi:hypothetical protein
MFPPYYETSQLSEIDTRSEVIRMTANWLFYDVVSSPASSCSIEGEIVWWLCFFNGDEYGKKQLWYTLTQQPGFPEVTVGRIWIRAPSECKLWVAIAQQI